MIVFQPNTAVQPIAFFKFNHRIAQTGWDTANAVAFLVSDEARYITGIELYVDGGISAGRG